MGALRTIPCPDCGKTHFLWQRCPCRRASKGAPGEGSVRRARASSGNGMVGTILTFILGFGVITIASLAVAEAKGPGFGIALVIASSLLLRLARLGYDWEDGVDIAMFLLPGPLDWPQKRESLVNLLTSPRAKFRALYFGGFLAVFVVLAYLGPQLLSKGGPRP